MMRAGRCDSKEILLAARDHDHVDRKLILHHVGSRGSYYKLPIAASAFGRDIVAVLYDADADCIAQTQVWWNANMPCVSLTPAGHPPNISLAAPHRFSTAPPHRVSDGEGRWSS